MAYPGKTGVLARSGPGPEGSGFLGPAVEPIIPGPELDPREASGGTESPAWDPQAGPSPGGSPLLVSVGACGAQSEAGARKQAVWVTPRHLRVPSPPRSSRGLTETVRVEQPCECSRSGQIYVASLFISHRHFAFSALNMSLNGSKHPNISLPQSHLQAQTRTGAPFWATDHLLRVPAGKARPREREHLLWPLSAELGPPQPWVPTHFPLHPPQPSRQIWAQEVPPMPC